jgi:phage shock protein C
MSNDVRRLYRSKKNRMLGGICGGLGHYFHIDATLVRLIFVLFGLIFLLPFPFVVVAYLIMWLVVPIEPEEAPAPAAEVIDTTAKE